MRVLVCGGRDFKDADRLEATLNALHQFGGIDLIIQGGAAGADSLAGHWAREYGVKQRVFHADWKRFGKAAGGARNQQMLAEGKPNLVVAFPGGRGTADMVRRAKEAGVHTIEIEPL